MSKLVENCGGFRKDASLFSNVILIGRSPNKCRISKMERKGIGIGEISVLFLLEIL